MRNNFDILPFNRGSDPAFEADPFKGITPGRGLNPIALSKRLSITYGRKGKSDRSRCQYFCIQIVYLQGLGLNGLDDVFLFWAAKTNGQGIRKKKESGPPYSDVGFTEYIVFSVPFYNPSKKIRTAKLIRFKFLSNISSLSLQRPLRFYPENFLVMLLNQPDA